MKGQYRECNDTRQLAVKQFHAHFRFEKVVVICDALFQELECIEVDDNCETLERHLHCCYEQKDCQKFQLEGFKLERVQQRHKSTHEHAKEGNQIFHRRKPPVIHYKER